MYVTKLVSVYRRSPQSLSLPSRQGQILSLSSNRYHVILRRRNHKGEACTNSREEDMEIDYCGCTNVLDAKPKPLEPSDVNQQVKIVPREGRIVEVSLLPNLLIQMGLNSSLRARLPGFDFPLSHDCSEAVFVGKWYCPFMFVKEGGVVVFVDAFVQREVVFVGGSEAIWDERNVSGEGFMLFKSFDGVRGETGVGLCMKVVERMKWEQERVGWVGGNERRVRVESRRVWGGQEAGGRDLVVMCW
ncbi:unnamed protein product [Prunus armeniaca]|uniref:Uncharacterized protein n=1 Tax=Prunus armeniaca TaxID=36596 RepID=A0A6J5W5F1_PRUAR|nr:unnamed protein product [Prunus armeniaca]